MYWSSAVASNTRGPGFESSHWQLLLNNYLLLTVCRKDEIKRGRERPIFLKKVLERKRWNRKTDEIKDRTIALEGGSLYYWSPV